MSVQENKAIARRIFEEIWNEGKRATGEELEAPDFVMHDPLVKGLARFEEQPQYFTLFHTAFPDLHFTIEEVIGEGEFVVVHWRARGTFSGAFSGIEPTGKSGEVTGFTMLRIVGGKAREGWTSRDDLGMLQQMGVLPDLFAVPV